MKQVQGDTLILESQRSWIYTGAVIHDSYLYHTVSGDKQVVNIAVYA